MATITTEKEKELLAQKFDADVREAEGQLKALQARAEARKAKTDMEEISGLTAAKERAKRNVAEIKSKVSAEYEASKRELEAEIRDLKAGIKRFDDRFEAWDDARDRRFNARLDEAEAKIKIWKARLDKKQVERTVKVHDQIATLEQQIALARAKDAEAREVKYSGKAQEALIDAAYYFDKAYDAAARHYEI
jgi:exonuclease VII small subunit